MFFDLDIEIKNFRENLTCEVFVYYNVTIDI